MEMTDKRWECMASWWAVFCGHEGEMATLASSHHVYSEYAWIELTLYVTNDANHRAITREEYEDVLEAMELVSLLACVDEDAWIQGLLKYTSGSSLVLADRGSYQPPRFAIRLVGYRPEDVEEDPDAAPACIQDAATLIHDMIHHMFSPVRHSAGFQEVKNELLSNVTDPSVREKCDQIKIPVVLEGMFWDNAVYTTFQLDLEDVYSRRHANLSPECPIWLEAMSISTEDPQASVEEAAQLGLLLSQRKLPLRDIDIFDIKWTSSIVVNGLKNSMHVNEVSRRFDLSGMYYSASERVAVFSALAANTSIKTMRLWLLQDWSESEHETTRRATLQWVAFSIFSQYSQSAIDTFEFEDDSFTTQNAQAMREVLTAANPLQILLDSSESECKTANLLEDHIISTSVVVPTGTKVWIIHNRPSEPRVDILLPGCGVYPVERSKLTQPEVVYRAKAVTFLKLFLDQGDNDFAPFIQVIGSHIERLSVQVRASTGSISSSHIQQVAGSCPKLKYLVLDGMDSEGLQAIVKAFDSALPCLDALHLEGFMTKEPEDLMQFISALGDTRHRMSLQLRELHLDLYGFDLSIDASLALRSALMSNNVLHTVFLKPGRHNYFEINDHVQSLPDVLIPIPHKPLALRSKFAFLSIVHNLSASDVIQDALGRVDSAIISLIFAFSAVPTKRIVVARRDP
ncbi:hypothetical protein Poli38472_011194 [Pythium oligandrum]|uniref:Uncharacterized protein n=1 Tax=Pythium oligandrum TaxID=41045 RepID=A0A8K1FNQ4_PYTOL|nr:hypothetical protein Poli38472_011194 [Pythium oligandrum]|eukprot:TMW67574.1 hypothetical protein Poli38472_011194 [Pythium oligandrum]